MKIKITTLIKQRNGRLSPAACVGTSPVPETLISMDRHGSDTVDRLSWSKLLLHEGSNRCSDDPDQARSRLFSRFKTKLKSGGIGDGSQISRTPLFMHSSSSRSDNPLKFMLQSPIWQRVFWFLAHQKWAPELLFISFGSGYLDKNERFLFIFSWELNNHSIRSARTLRNKQIPRKTVKTETGSNLAEASPGGSTGSFWRDLAARGFLGFLGFDSFCRYAYFVISLTCMLSCLVSQTHG